jgi:hypothetical protein
VKWEGVSREGERGIWVTRQGVRESVEQGLDSCCPFCHWWTAPLVASYIGILVPSAKSFTRTKPPIFCFSLVMGNPGLDCGPNLEVAVHNVAELVTQPKTGLNAGRT